MGDEARIDWSSAAVQDGQLIVAVTGKPSSEWADAVPRVIDRLQHGASHWGVIKVTKKKVRVDDVEPGSEADLRHLLDSAVLQANASVKHDEDDDPEPEEERSEADQQMTDAFRAFADDNAP